MVAKEGSQYVDVIQMKSREHKGGNSCQKSQLRANVKATNRKRLLKNLSLMHTPQNSFQASLWHLDNRNTFLLLCQLFSLMCKDLSATLILNWIPNEKRLENL